MFHPRDGGRDVMEVTACVTRLVTLIVCILGVVILERAMLYQNVGRNGSEQYLCELIVKHIRCKPDIKSR